jgi:hypothetical protein
VLAVNCLHIRERTLSQNSLCDHSTKSKHGQTAVSDFLELHVIDLSLGLSGKEADGVKSEVTRLTARSLHHLHDSNGTDSLGKTDPEEQLSHSTILHKGIVGGDRGKSLVCHRSRVDPEAHVDGSESDNGKLAHTSVLQLSLAEEVHGREVREAEGVEANISDVSSEIGWVLKERKRLTGNVGGGGGGLLLDGLSGSSIRPDERSRTSCIKRNIINRQQTDRSYTR